MQLMIRRCHATSVEEALITTEIHIREKGGPGRRDVQRHRWVRRRIQQRGTVALEMHN